MCGNGAFIRYKDYDQSFLNSFLGSFPFKIEGFKRNTNIRIVYIG